MGDLLHTQLGDYRILEPIGSGGMGEVYLAEHVRLRKLYALKVLPSALSRDREFVARFHREARVMAELKHARIVEVHHMGESGGTHFLVMDYVAGPGPARKPLSLEEHLGAQPGHRLPEARAWKWAVQIAQALAYAHARGVVHRDLKPANILIDAEGNAKLTDFGLAKAVGQRFILTRIHESLAKRRPAGSIDDLDLAETLRGDGARARGACDDIDHAETRAAAAAGPASARSDNSVLGTYDYMAPEQRGEGGEINPTTDVYGFGLVLYRILTGKRLKGFAKPPSGLVPGLSQGWDKIVVRCLAEEQSARYRGAEALLEDLRSVRLRRRGSPAVLVAAACALVVLLAVGIWTALDRREVQIPSGQQPKAQAAAMQAEVSAPSAAAQTPAPSQAAEAVARAEVIRLKGEAELVWDKVRALDRGQGFATILDEAEKSHRNARDFLEESLLSEAKAAYRDLLERSQTLLELERQRGAARSAMTKAQQAAEAASAAGAEENASILWQEAQGKGRTAGEAYEAGRFAEAASGWKSADESYAKAELHARRVATERDGALEAKRGAEAAASAAKAAGATELASELWQEANLAVKEAGLAYSAGRFSDAAATWRSAEEGFKSSDAAATWRSVEEGFKRAEVRAQGVAKVREAKRAYEEELRRHDQGELARYGGQAWREACEALQRAQGAGEDHDKAEEEYRKAKELLPKAARAVQVAKLLEKARDDQGLDKRESALVAVEEILRMDPGNAEAAQLKERITRSAGAAEKAFTNGLGMRLAYMPPGEFLMGSPPGEEGRGVDETQHRVRITRPFYLGVTEVTQAQWKAVMGTSPSSFKGDKLPVEQVSWEDAKEFCRKLSEREGKSYRLPTEAEWEYACRVGTTTPFHTGSTISTSQANYDGNDTYGSGQKGVSRHKTVDVGSFPANPWGLHDMHGNVWEWCEDWYGEYPPGEVADPKGPSTGVSRVLRGGSWIDGPRFCRSASRYGHVPGVRGSGLGFRVALDLSPITEPAIDGVIAAVDLKEGLVLLDAGADQGIKVGVEFIVYRANQFIAKVQVLKVYDDLSGAKILYTLEGAEIKVGDKATTRL
ncbi:MAG: SUMF1/EgtB/PvdO family nonheme iron enzyme [Planctomycetes bacterium]|nr:SUMF1/EgtB/PvdO family nonheme iron enzyme [Planctomycetota bacterium]